MDLEVEIKEEPVLLEGTAITSLENFELVSEMIPLKQETKSELVEPGPAQENTLEPSADIKQEIFREQHIVHQLVPYIKEEYKNFVPTEECSSSAHLSQHPTHMITDCDERISCCDVCSSTFTNQTVLQRHMVTNHSGKRPRPYHCNKCNRSFLDSNKQRTHMASHSEERPYHCEECGKTFIWRGQLLVHIKTHSEGSQYRCDVCNRSFRAKKALIPHMLIHSGEKPYRCNVCTSTFRTNCALKYHLSIHSADKPYQCETCNKSYVNLTRLRNHMLIHSVNLLERKPYYCIICNRSYTTRGNLITHLVTHSRIKAIDL